MTINGNVITPEPGKWLYNGEICSDMVIIGKNASAENWVEVDEYIEPQAQEEATEADFLQALEEVGILDTD